MKRNEQRVKVTETWQKLEGHKLYYESEVYTKLWMIHKSVNVEAYGIA